MTTHVLERSCMFCNRPARRRPAPGEFPAHDFDCVSCGRYRVGETAEARMRGNGVSLYLGIVSKIIGANQDGYRLVIPSCFRVSFANEQTLTVVANADRPVKHDEEEVLVPRPTHRPLLTNSFPTPDRIVSRPKAI